MRRLLGLLILLLMLLFIAVSFVEKADASELVGTVTTKGIFFKDKLEIWSFHDPQISGVTCYTTRHKRALSFRDSSSVSLSCRQTGPIDLSGAHDASGVFSTDKGLFIKKTVVDRFIDKNNNVIIYLTYTKGMKRKNNSHSISTVVVKKW